MLSSLTPVGEAARGQRWWITTIAFTIGSLAGGAATGLVVGALGVLVAPPVRVALVLLAVAVAAAIGADVAGITPPSLRRQVDRTWMTRYRGWVYGVGYGAQLGTGLVTYISSWSTYAMVVEMVLVGRVEVAVALGAAHGLVRAASVWSTVRLTSSLAIRTHHGLLHRIDPGILVTCRLALALASVAAVAAAWS